MHPTLPDARRAARRLPLLVLPALLALLGACGTYGPGRLAAGDSAAAVAERMGPPTARHPLPEGGTRLEYARGPFGKDTYMIDLDASQRVTQVRQVLDERTFEALPLGLTREEVRARIGTPSSTMRIARQNLDIWSYRYFTNFCQWFQVSMDITTGRLVEKGYGPDPMCDVRDEPHALMLGPGFGGGPAMTDAPRLYGIPNCDTVKRARRYLEEQGRTAHFHDLRRDGLDAARLQRWARALGWQALLNRRGTTWRALDAAAQAQADAPAGAQALMLAQPALIRRPVVEWPDGTVSVGFDPQDWAGRLVTTPVRTPPAPPAGR